MKQRLFFCSIFVAMLHPIFAQTNISGSILDAQDEPLPFANVLLLQAADSTLIKGEISSETGTYDIEISETGDFFISATMVGLQTINSEPFSVRNKGEKIQLDPIRLLEEATTLEGVQVVAKKPLFEQKIDRLVVNVQNSITSAGSTALEVLERSPGVVVNRQNQALSLAGKQGVVVMINGKISRTPIAAVVQMLQGMSADNIEKIELITTPPANYDAEGDAGFINIVLKKTADAGLNGSFTLSGGVGEGTTSAASMNFNYRKKRVNLYGNYSFARQAQKQYFTNFRSVLNEDARIVSETESERDPIQLNHNARLGLDLQVTDKTVVGLLVSAYDNKWTMDAVNQVDVLVNNQLDTAIRLDNKELNQWRHVGGNLNVQHEFDQETTLTFDVDYLYYRNENPTDYINSYTDGMGDFLFVDSTQSGKITPVNIGVGKLDFAKKLNEKVRLETGLKAAISRFENDVSVSRTVNGMLVNDPNFTAKFNLEEEILAAYAALDIQLSEKISIKAGLRYEHTISNLGSEDQPDIVDRNYGNFFPTLFVSRTLNENSNVNFSYSRRITRPTFNDMAPFVIFIDPNTFFSGNSAVQPALSNTFKVDYRLKTFLISASFSQDDEAIAGFQPRLDPETNQTRIGAQNLNYRRTISSFVNFPIKMTKWWSSRFNWGIRWQETEADFDENTLKFDQTTWNGNGAFTFTLPQNISAEINGFYFSKQLFGTAFARPVWGVNFGLQKQLNNNNGTLRFGIDDIFESIEWLAETNIPEQNFINRGGFDFSVRTFKLSYSRNFGNTKLKSSRKRATGAEEERQRVN